MLVYALAIVSSVFTCLPFFIAVCRKKNHTGANAYLLYYFAAGMVTEVLSFVLKRRSVNNGLVFNIFSAAEVALLFLYYHAIMKRKRWLLTGLFVVCVAGTMLVFVCFDSPFSFSLKARFLALLFLLAVSATYLFELVRLDPSKPFSAYRSFWTSAAIQVYAMGNLLYFLSFNLLMGLQARHLIHVALNISYNILLIWPLLMKRTSRG